jgi:eukaryotic-like serine/threonine-protein kinase
MTLLAMVANKLDPAQLRAIEDHVAGCTDCKRAVAAALAAGSTAMDTPSTGDEGALAALVGVTINDRYEIKTLVGRGGVGAVYLARDRSLGRDVALKVHRAGSGNERLHREAVAMAQLAHPNVVTVFEVATFDERLYVAMEYIRGDTLRGWLAAAPRTWREIVDMLLAAGRGLAAAHAAELVHRDFKPENVLVGEDGRARVSDFGLARARGAPVDVVPLTPGSSLDTPITVTGAVMGTPAYMALEQLAGAPVDARSDQFAFCVVAWECLYGTRPFVGSTIAALALAIERHDLQLPKKAGIPERIRKVLERGLAAEPEARYPDMAALLAQLRSAAAPRTRRALAIGAAALVPAAAIAAVVFARSAAGGDAAVRCEVPSDALAGAWDTQVRDKLRAAYAPLKQGEQLFARVSDALDHYRSAWIDMRRASCEATRVHGEQSETLLDLRMECLDRKRDELRSLAHGLAEADRKVAAGAVRAALGLSPVADCADTAALNAPLRLPDAGLRARVKVERATLAEVRALRLLGKNKVALDKAREVVAHAKELKYRPLEAEALLVAGDLEDRNGDTPAAITELEQAVVAANAGNHKLVAAEAWSTLAWLEGFVQRSFDRADLAVRMAAAALEAVGGNDMLSAQLVNYEALILETKGQLAPAKAKYLQSVAAFERMGKRDSWEIALALNDLGGVERRLGEFADARAHHERALAIRKRVFGDAHPYVFSSTLNIGNVAFSQGDYKAAEARYREALAIAAEVFPPQHPQTALALANLGSTLDHEERYPEAIETLQRAVAMYEAVRGPEHPDTADAVHNLANVLAHAERLPEAKQAYERALGLIDKGGGGDPDPSLAGVLGDYGEELATIPAERHRAEHMLQRALDLGAKAKAEESDLAFPLTALGELYVATGRAAQAVPLLERALAARAEPSEDKARTELALAGALWRSDRSRALALGAAAEAHAEHASSKLHGQIARWRAAHH